MKKEISPLKQKIFAEHKPGKSTADRGEYFREIRLFESFETNDLKIFTAMFTDVLNGYAAQGSYHLNDRFEDYDICITTRLLRYWLSGMLNS